MAQPSPDSTSGKIKIAILDDYANTSHSIIDAFLNSYPSLASKLHFDFFPSTLNTRTPAGLAASITRLQGYGIISTMRERTPFSRELLGALPDLKLLLTTGTRNAGLDLAACAERGVVVAGTTTPFGSTNEQAWALILAVAKAVPSLDALVKRGVGVGMQQRDGDGDAGWQDGTNVSLGGKTLGLLGLGKLGTECAVTGKLGFGMEVVAWSENLTQDKADQAAVSHGLAKGSFRVARSKEELFRSADVLSLHYVLSERSRGMVGETELGWMKSSALLVNTSRGPLVDEGALVKVLREGKLRGVGLDVFDIEPLPRDSVWRSEEWGRRVVLSPHMGYVVEDTMNSWYEQTVENVRRWVEGEELLNAMKA